MSKSPNSQYLRRPDIQRPDIHSGAGVCDWAGGFWAAWRRCIVNAVHLPHATSEAMRQCSDVVSALSSVTADDGGKVAAKGGRFCARCKSSVHTNSKRLASINSVLLREAYLPEVACPPMAVCACQQHQVE